MRQNNKCTEENSNPIQDLINARKLIKNNAGIKLPQPYITGIINYEYVKNILKKCKCVYEDRICDFGRIISNVKFNEELCKYEYLSAILSLHNDSIMFLEHL